MAYCSVDDVRAALTPAGEDSGMQDGQGKNTAAQLTDEFLQDQIAEGDSRIDFYLGGRYTVPVVSPPNVIRYWSRTIGAYLATLTFLRNQPLAVDATIVLRYEGVMAQLLAVQAGTADIPIPPVVVNPTGSDVFPPSFDSGFDVFDYGVAYPTPNVVYNWI